MATATWISWIHSSSPATAVSERSSVWRGPCRACANKVIRESIGAGWPRSAQVSELTQFGLTQSRGCRTQKAAMHGWRHSAAICFHSCIFFREVSDVLQLSKPLFLHMQPGHDVNMPLSQGLGAASGCTKLSDAYSRFLAVSFIPGLRSIDVELFMTKFT